MQTLTDSHSTTRARKAARLGVDAFPRERVQLAASRDVCAAWQGLLGPAPLPPDLLETLTRLSSVRQVTAGQRVLSRDEFVSDLRVLVLGDVGLGVLIPPAPLRVERSLRGPAWLDLSSAWLNCSPAVDGVALSDAVLISVARGAYQTLMARQSELARRTVTCLAEQLHTAMGKTHDLMHKDAQARLAGWLLQRCDGSAASLRIVLRERKRDIASQLAVTPETLSRLLKQFSADGSIAVRGYSVTVLDAQRLRAHAAS